MPIVLFQLFIHRLLILHKFVQKSPKDPNTTMLQNRRGVPMNCEGMREKVNSRDTTASNKKHAL